MEITLCRCSWNIPGVKELPLHWHKYTGNLVGTGRFWDRGFFAGEEIMAMEMDEFTIGIVVPWKELARG